MEREVITLYWQWTGFWKCIERTSKYLSPLFQNLRYINQMLECNLGVDCFNLLRRILKVRWTVNNTKFVMSDWYNLNTCLLARFVVYHNQNMHQTDYYLFQTNMTAQLNRYLFEYISNLIQYFYIIHLHNISSKYLIFLIQNNFFDNPYTWHCIQLFIPRCHKNPYPNA